MLKIWLILVLLLPLSVLEASDSVRGFIKINNKRELFVDYQKAKKGEATIVLLNGLTYSTQTWENFVQYLNPQKTGFGVLRYDAFGQGKTLSKYGPVYSVISYKEQVEDLKNLLQALKIKEPVYLLGLSYGAALAMAFNKAYPQYVDSIISMAPYVAPLATQDLWIRQQIVYTRKMAPYNPASDDELYDYFLRNLVYTTYPLAEPSVLENPYKLEGVFRMVQGIRKFEAHNFVSAIPPQGYHLMIAERDQYIERAIHDEHWKSLPVSARGSRLYIKFSEHKIPEAFPRFAAFWVKKILQKAADLKQGKSFRADPMNGRIEELR